MQMENTFTIAAPIEEAWRALNNPEAVAPCFPGATLTEYDGNSFNGTVKVKLGPISLAYEGTGTYVERDDAAHRVVIDASGRDSRGNGTASAKVIGSMTAVGTDRTQVTMVTEMTITGRPAQFGRGVITDVSGKIIGQFASCLTEKLGARGDAKKEPAAPGTPSSAPGGAMAHSSGAAPAESSMTEQSQIEAIDLLGAAVAPVLKRIAPVAGVIVVALLAILLIMRGLR